MHQSELSVVCHCLHFRYLSSRVPCISYCYKVLTRIEIQICAQYFQKHRHYLKNTFGNYATTYITRAFGVHSSGPLQIPDWMLQQVKTHRVSEVNALSHTMLFQTTIFIFLLYSNFPILIAIPPRFFPLV